MTKSKIFSAFIIFLFSAGFNKISAQTNPNTNIAIVLNEYCVGNYVLADNYGYTSDWVEIHNAHTSSVSLAGYYLSNDKNNLFKWQFPASFTLDVGGFKEVWLSGKNTVTQTGSTFYYHASFNIEQCKDQWLILSTPQGAIRDSVFIQKTQAGHTRGRIDRDIKGILGWRIFTNHSFILPNPTSNYYRDYLPTPTFTPAAGWGHNGETLDMFLGNSEFPYDSADTLNCYEIHYTTNGCYPTQSDPVYTYTSGVLCGATAAPIIILDNQMFRAVTYPKMPPPGGSCDPTLAARPYCYPELDEYLPSFCQTNTYFSESTGSLDNLDPRFGVMSLAVSCADTMFFSQSSNGLPPIKQNAHVEYFDGKTEILEGYCQIDRPLHESWATKQRGFYVTIDDRRGFGCNFEGNIFNNSCLGTTSRTVFPTLHVHGGDYESLSQKNGAALTDNAVGTGIRDVFIQSLAVKYNLKVNPLHMKPMILFINGKYKGVFNLREVYDKFYESYYNGQPKDSLYLQQFHGGVDSYVTHPIDDGTSVLNPINKFKTEVSDFIAIRPMNSTSYYNTAMSRLDKESYIDYMILNSYAMNSDLWYNNIGFGKGTSTSKNGDRWHYYLWNMPAIFNYTAVNISPSLFGSYDHSPCYTHNAVYPVSALGGNAHGMMMRRLMDPIQGNFSFQLDYKNRYQDLLNTALKCENILSHYDCVTELFSKEMKFHEDLASTPSGAYTSQIGDWDTNTTRLRKIIELRCQLMSVNFNTVGCYGMFGPHKIAVDVFPEESGKVKLNSIVLPSYSWNGQYYNTQISFKAIPTSTNYVFHHWEFKSHFTKNNAPLSLDSVAIDFNQADEVLAVFTDVTTDIDMPTGFTPNGDGNNDEFRPMGSALFTSEYEFRIWNRWGQEVFRSTEPSKGWDGYFEGKPSQTGVYAYVITYKNVYNEAKVKKGNVTLVR